MKKSRFTHEQIAFALKQAESGVPAVDVCRKLGIRQQMFSFCKKKFVVLSNSKIRSRSSWWLT